MSALAELAGELVEVHGQHEGQRLLSTVAQTRFLDRFAGGEHLDAVEDLRVEHGRLREATAALAELDERERDRERQMDLLAYQVREIETAAPRAGETDQLKLEAARLDHAGRLLERASSAERSLAAEDGAADALGAASAELRAAGEVDPGAEELAARAFELSAAATELAVEVRGYRERLELDPARLQEVRERIDALDALRRKYGNGEEEVLAFGDRARKSSTRSRAWSRSGSVPPPRSPNAPSASGRWQSWSRTAVPVPCPSSARRSSGSSASSGWRVPRSRSPWSRTRS